MDFQALENSFRLFLQLVNSIVLSYSKKRWIILPWKAEKVPDPFDSVGSAVQRAVHRHEGIRHECYRTRRGREGDDRNEQVGKKKRLILVKFFTEFWVFLVGLSGSMDCGDLGKFGCLYWTV